MPPLAPSQTGASGPIVARILLEIAAVHFRPDEPFTLTSGRKSPVYIDCRKIIAFPRARAKVTALAADLVEREIGFESLDAVAGGETAGIPYAAWLADRLGLPMAYIRKKPKGFGRGAQIEGDLQPGARTLLVEDLATDGGSKVNFINAIRQAECTVAHALVVFHYGIFPQSL
ncbi:MAG: orotate phosphoribosyltransferase, partial [Rhodospirillaceae bacterium]|nr:orotate phosphoribosyltransferase [Rhodospirillaceae bacterium]